MKISKRALNRAVRIIEAAENRCLACDGPVGSTLAEMTTWEMDEVSRLLKKDVLTENVLRSAWREAQKARRVKPHTE